MSERSERSIYADALPKIKRPPLASSSYLRQHAAPPFSVEALLGHQKSVKQLLFGIFLDVLGHILYIRLGSRYRLKQVWSSVSFATQ